MIWLWILPIFSVATVWVSFETIRYQHTKDDCIQQQQKDVDLLSRDVCADAEDRLKFQKVVDCESAERRLRLTIDQCTKQKWISNLFVVDVYTYLCNSYYTTVTCIMIIVLWYMWLWSKRKSEAHALDKMEHIANQFNTRQYLLK